MLVDLVTDDSKSQSANEGEKGSKIVTDPSLPSQQQQLILEQQQEQHMLNVRDCFLFHINFDQIV